MSRSPRNALLHDDPYEEIVAIFQSPQSPEFPLNRFYTQGTPPPFLIGEIQNFPNQLSPPRRDRTPQRRDRTPQRRDRTPPRRDRTPQRINRAGPPQLVRRRSGPYRRRYSHTIVGDPYITPNQPSRRPRSPFVSPQRVREMVDANNAFRQLIRQIERDQQRGVATRNIMDRNMFGNSREGVLQILNEYW